MAIKSNSKKATVKLKMNELLIRNARFMAAVDGRTLSQWLVRLMGAEFKRQGGILRKPPIPEPNSGRLSIHCTKSERILLEQRFTRDGDSINSGCIRIIRSYLNSEPDPTRIEINALEAQRTELTVISNSLRKCHSLKDCCVTETQIQSIESSIIKTNTRIDDLVQAVHQRKIRID